MKIRMRFSRISGGAVLLLLLALSALGQVSNSTAIAAQPSSEISSPFGPAAASSSAAASAAEPSPGLPSSAVPSADAASDAASSSDAPSPDAPSLTPPSAGDLSTLALDASATLTTEQVSQPEVIFLYSFPLPPGTQSFLGLKGDVSLSSPEAVFNESLDTVATNPSGACPADGTTFPNYTAVYQAYPNLQPLQGFILKNPEKGVSKVDIDYTMPVGLPISDCMVVMLDWEGGSKVTMRSRLTMSYTTKPIPQGIPLPTNEEFVFGIYIGPGSTVNDSLSFVQETEIAQPGAIVAFVGDVSASTFGIPAPPGKWTARNDIYLVPGGCPKDIHVNGGGWTPKGGHYYADLPANAKHLFTAPVSGYQVAYGQKFIYLPANVNVEKGDCLLTLFGVRAPKGGIDSENQVHAVFLPAQ